MEGTRGAPRTLFCDTNVLVRLLTNDPPAQARAAERALTAAGAGRFGLIITDVVVTELAFVLTRVGGLPRVTAGELIGRVLELTGVEVADADVLRDAIAIWSSTRPDFPDAYLAALARRTVGGGVLSFDRDFDRLPAVKRIDPHTVAAVGGS